MAAFRMQQSPLTPAGSMFYDRKPAQPIYTESGYADKVNY